MNELKLISVAGELVTLLILYYVILYYICIFFVVKFQFPRLCSLLSGYVVSKWFICLYFVCFKYDLNQVAVVLLTWTFGHGIQSEFMGISGILGSLWMGLC